MTTTVKDKVLEELNKTYTISEWLKEYKEILEISKSLKSQFSILASKYYKAIRDKEPNKEFRKTDEGKTNNGVIVYTIKDFGILEQAFIDLMLPL